MMDPATGDFAKDDPVEHKKQRPVTSAVIIVLPGSPSVSPVIAAGLAPSW